MSDKFKNYLHDKLFLHKWLSTHYVTCSASRVSEDDIEYIRKDISDDRIKELEAKIIAETVEKCIRFVENGRFLHDDAPAANLARELVSEMRTQLLPTGSKG